MYPLCRPVRNSEGRWVTGREIWDALMPLEGLELFQVVQDSERDYTLRVVAEPGRRPDGTALDSALETLLGPRARVRREDVVALRPEASGKLMLVKSRTYEDFRPAGLRGQTPPIN